MCVNTNTNHYILCNVILLFYYVRILDVYGPHNCYLVLKMCFDLLHTGDAGLAFIGNSIYNNSIVVITDIDEGLR